MSAGLRTYIVEFEDGWDTCITAPSADQARTLARRYVAEHGPIREVD